MTFNAEGYGLIRRVGGGLPSGLGIRGVIAVAVVARDPARGPLPSAVYTAWMSQPCRSSCMNGTFTSYAPVLMMPAGQVAQQRTIRRTGSGRWHAGILLPPINPKGHPQGVMPGNLGARHCGSEAGRGEPGESRAAKPSRPEGDVSR
jgi:hypothetical protein